MSTSIISDIPTSNVPPTDLIPKRMRQSQFSLNKIEEEEVDCVIRNLATDKAIGIDLIPATFITRLHLFLSKPIYMLVNKSIESSKVPALWKSAIVSPTGAHN